MVFLAVRMIPHFLWNGKAFDGKVRKLVLLGATREKIAQSAHANGFDDIIMADTFEEAFEQCVKYAESDLRK